MPAPNAASARGRRSSQTIVRISGSPAASRSHGASIPELPSASEAAIAASDASASSRISGAARILPIRHSSRLISAGMERKTDYIDAEGYRANVGIVLMNDDRQVFIGGRVGARGWQFPQGGIRRGERPEEALYRELAEEVGLRAARSRKSRARRPGCATACRRSSCAAIRARSASARSSAGSCCGSARRTPRCASIPPSNRRSSTAGAGSTGGMRCTTSSISSAVSIRARCTSSARTRFRRGCRRIRTGGRSAWVPAAGADPDGLSQNGRATASSTMPIRSSEGASLNHRYQRSLCALRPAARSRSSRPIQA